MLENLGRRNDDALWTGLAGVAGAVGLLAIGSAANRGAAAVSSA